MYPPYAWLEPQAKHLSEYRQRWAHAWLISGAEGIGKYAFARWMAYSLLCETPLEKDEPCGQCTSCQWLTHHRHPDYYPCLPDNIENPDFSFLSYAESDWIKLDIIRKLHTRIYLPAHRQQAKVILIYPAELVNPAASNALLKLLEEPPSNTYFLLITHHPHQVLPTLRSRCHQLKLATPRTETVAAWCKAADISADDLAQTGQAPLKALSLKKTHESFKPLLQSLFNMNQKVDVDNWKSWIDKCPKAERRSALVYAIDSIRKLSHDWLRVHHGLPPRFFPSQHIVFNKNLCRISIPKLLNLDYALNTVQQHSKHPLNPAWLLEHAVIQYAALWY